MFRSIYMTVVYATLFIISLYFAACAENSITSKRKIRFILYSTLSILPIVLFAGYRGENVGTDIKVYAIPEFNRCLSAGNLTSYLYLSNTDRGYALIVALSALLTKRMNVLLMITEIFQLIPIYVVAYKLKNKTNMWKTLLVFYMLHYIVGFNIMRQSISASFIILGYIYCIYEKRIVPGVINAIIALQFHSTAVIGIVMIAVGYIICSVKNKYLRKIFLFAGTILLFVPMLYWYDLAKFILKLGILPVSKFQRYIDVFTGVNIGEKSYMFEIQGSQYLEIILKALCFFVPSLVTLIRENRILEKNTKEETQEFYNSVLFLSMIGVVINALMLFLFHTAYGYRVTIYSEFFLIILIPLSAQKRIYYSTKKRNNGGLLYIKRINTNNYEIANFITMFLYFFLIFMVGGHHETLPFYFQIY